MNEARGLDTTVAPAVHPLAAAPHEPDVLPDDGTVLAMGRRFRSAVDRFAALDRQHAAMPVDAPDETQVRGWVQRADRERNRLFDRIFTRRAETLGDVAVLAAHGFHRVDAMLEMPPGAAVMEDHLGQLRWAFANVAVVTAAAAGLDLGQFGYPSLARSIKRTLAVRGA